MYVYTRRRGRGNLSRCFSWCLVVTQVYIWQHCLSLSFQVPVNCRIASLSILLLM